MRRREAELRAWTAGRRVGFRGPVGFWFVPEPPRFDRDAKRPVVRYRQHRRLTAAELAFWWSLPIDQRQLIAARFGPESAADPVVREPGRRLIRETFE